MRPWPLGRALDSLTPSLSHRMGVLHDTFCAFSVVVLVILLVLMLLESAVTASSTSTTILKKLSCSEHRMGESTRMGGGGDFVIRREPVGAGILVPAFSGHRIVPP
jgi:hypothetical protein